MIPLLLGLVRPAEGQPPEGGASLQTLVASDQSPANLRAAALVAVGEAQVRVIWPGFWDEHAVFGVFPVSGGTVIVHPLNRRPPATLVPVPTPIPAALRDRAAFVPDRRGEFVFDLNFALGAARVPVFSSLGPMGRQRTDRPASHWTRDSVGTFVVFMLHEGFHAFQLREFAPLPSQTSPLADQAPIRPYRELVAAPSVARALDDERELLATAVETASCSEASPIVLRYGERRKRRLAQLPAPFADYEDAQERAEGVATWVGIVGVHRLLTKDSAGTRHDVVADLRHAYQDAAGRPFAGWPRYASWHLYAAGAAKAFLLARCGDTSWQRQTSEGRSLQALLEQSMRVQSGRARS